MMCDINIPAAHLIGHRAWTTDRQLLDNTRDTLDGTCFKCEH